MRASLGTWLLQISNLSKSKLEVIGFRNTVVELLIKKTASSSRKNRNEIIDLAFTIPCDRSKGLNLVLPGEKIILDQIKE